jgi:hypothetical protein
VYTNYEHDLSWYRTVLSVLELHSILEWNQTEIDRVNPLKKQGRCHIIWKLHELIDEWIEFGTRIISVLRCTTEMIWWWCSLRTTAPIVDQRLVLNSGHQDDARHETRSPIRHGDRRRQLSEAREALDMMSRVLKQASANPSALVWILKRSNGARIWNR